MNIANQFRWIILYWMPYDNNLARFEQPIIEMLHRGVQSDDLLVAVQSDTSSSEHMHRSIISNTGIVVEAAATSDSSSAEAFAEYITWVRAQFNAAHWAFVFLGHGGRLDEFSPDMRTAINPRWMNIHDVANIISDFRKENQVDLIFLQNCCKGTLEANYTFRNCTEYILSSQTVLGAPNYYYEQTFRALSLSDMDGSGLASKIIDTEANYMYNSYVVVSSASLRDLPKRITPLIEAMLTTKTRHFHIGEFESYTYTTERLIDVNHFLKFLASISTTTMELYEQFHEFYCRDLIHRFQESPDARTKGLSGRASAS